MYLHPGQSLPVPPVSWCKRWEWYPLSPPLTSPSGMPSAMPQTLTIELMSCVIYILVSCTCLNFGNVLYLLAILHGMDNSLEFIVSLHTQNRHRRPQQVLSERVVWPPHLLSFCERTTLFSSSSSSLNVNTLQGRRCTNTNSKISTCYIKSWREHEHWVNHGMCLWKN